MAGGFNRADDLSLPKKLRQVTWGLVLLITITACVGFVALYSAANGSLDPWASRQMARFALGMVIMLVAALVDIRFWHRVSYACFAGGVLLLVAVEIMGHIGMGAQRWIDLGFMKLQPSELMKIGVIMALARYFHAASLEEVRKPFALIKPLMLVLAPTALILKQPDLGTSLMLILAAGAVFFLAGVPLWMFGVIIAGGLAAIPVVWEFMHDYQKQRVLTFLDPESDPLGAGYHIMQSKIALGSGGIDGKGFLQGTQSHLNFLPEKQTDFIFTLFAEEWGLLGGLCLLGLFALIFLYGMLISIRCRSQYGRLLAQGLMINFALYVFVNIAMVMGLIPVVGAPLPLISYGGTAMLAVMAGFGLIINVYIHRDVKLSRRPPNIFGVI